MHRNIVPPVHKYQKLVEIRTIANIRIATVLVAFTSIQYTTKIIAVIFIVCLS